MTPIDALEAEPHQRRSTEQLAEANQALALVLREGGAGFVAVDRAGHITRMNGVAEEVTGWSEAEARGRSVWDVFERLDRPADYRSLNPVDLLVGHPEEEHAHPVVVCSRDGRRTSIELRSVLSRSADGGATPRNWPS